MKAILIIIIAAVIGTEILVTTWRLIEPEPATGPVFSLPMAKAEYDNPTKSFKEALHLYQCDRGAEIKFDGPDGTKVTTFYFEWDMLQMGPLVEILGHTPEECNIAAGLTSQGFGPFRSYPGPDGPDQLGFKTSILAGSDGKPIYIYKMPWIQGLGVLDIEKSGSRAVRLERSFIRMRGQGRVLECAVYHANSEEQAWQIFQSQVLDTLVWTDPETPPASATLNP